MTSAIHFRILVLSISLAALSAGCLAPPGRIDGTNYPGAASPFVAQSLSESGTQLEPSQALPEQADLIHRLVLIGDGGVPMESEPVLATLSQWADVQPESTTVLFLGDNVYPAGIEEDAVEEGEEVMRKQIASTSARRVFIPGNHDWGHVGTDRLLREQAYVDANGAEFTPRDGCPGPALLQIVPPSERGARGISAILFDIDPWYFAEETVADCPDNTTPEGLASEIGELLREHEDEWLIVGAHHPLRTGGPHGGYTRGAVLDFVTGLIYMIFGTLQDTTEDQYRAIMAPIKEALASSPPLLYAAGHDHNLQVLDGDPYSAYEVVSGAGATMRVDEGHVTDIEGTLFAHGHAGFMVVDFTRVSGGAEGEGAERAVLHVIETGRDAPVFSLELGVR